MQLFGIFKNLIGDVAIEKLGNEYIAFVETTTTMSAEENRFFLEDFVCLRKKLESRKTSMSPSEAIQYGQELRLEAERLFEIDIIKHCVLWLAGAWLEVQVRGAKSVRALNFKDLYASDGVESHFKKEESELLGTTESIEVISDLIKRQLAVLDVESSSAVVYDLGFLGFIFTFIPDAVTAQRHYFHGGCGPSQMYNRMSYRSTNPLRLEDETKAYTSIFGSHIGPLLLRRSVKLCTKKQFSIGAMFGSSAAFFIYPPNPVTRLYGVENLIYLDDYLKTNTWKPLGSL